MNASEGRRRESEIIERFSNRLVLEKGYPRELLAPHLGFPDGSFVDLVLLHPDPTKLLAALEFKVSQAADAAASIRLRKSLQRLAAFGYGIPIFGLLVTSAGESLFQLASDGHIAPLDFDAFPSYSQLVGTASVRSETEKKTALRAVAIRSYVMAAFLALLFLFGVWGWWAPSWPLLTLLGAAVALVFLPDLKRFRAGEFEAEFWPTSETHDKGDG